MSVRPSFGVTANVLLDFPTQEEHHFLKFNVYTGTAYCELE